MPTAERSSGNFTISRSPGPSAFGVESSVGGWFDTNPFPDVAGTRRTTGTGGAYATFDQILWKPRHSRPISAGNAIAAEESEPLPSDVEEFPGGVALTSSVSWADPLANRVDGNLLGGLTWTGAIPGRMIDVLGGGVTVAHFSGSATTRDPAETAIEALYRIRFTQWVSLKPDFQYIVHPGGAGEFDEAVRRDAIVLTLRLEMSF